MVRLRYIGTVVVICFFKKTVRKIILLRTVCIFGQFCKLIFIFSLWLYEVTSILSKIQQESHKYS